MQQPFNKSSRVDGSKVDTKFSLDFLSMDQRDDLKMLWIITTMSWQLCKPYLWVCLCIMIESYCTASNGHCEIVMPTAVERLWFTFMAIVEAVVCGAVKIRCAVLDLINLILYCHSTKVQSLSWIWHGKKKKSDKQNIKKCSVNFNK